MKRVLFLLSASLALPTIGCPKSPPAGSDAKPPVTENETGDAAMPAPPPLEDDAKTPCEKACGHLAKLSCPESKGFPGGKSCVDVCTENENTPFAIRVDCIVAAQDQAAVQKCNVRCQP